MNHQRFHFFRTKRLKMSKKQLAAALGLHRNTIGCYEMALRPIPKHIALAISALLHDLPPAE